jgi:thioredoxin 1
VHLGRRHVRAAVEELGEPEVEQLDLARVRHHHVGGLDVAVEHVAPVRRREAARHAERELQRALPGHGLRQLVERLPLDQLVGDVRLALHLADAVHAHHVGVQEPRDGARLDAEAIARRELGIGHGEELERHGPIERVVASQVDVPHPSAPERPDHPEAVELGGRREAVLRRSGGLFATHRPHVTTAGAAFVPGARPRLGSRRRHAGVEGGLGPVQEYRDVPRRDAQRFGDVLPRLLLEHAQRHHGALDLAQLRHTGAQPDVVLGAGDHVVHRRARGGDRRRLDLGVRPREEVTPPPVPRRVPHHAREHGAPLLRILRQRVVPRHGEHGAEAILDAVDRVLRAHPFRPRQRRQRRALGAHDVREPAQDIIAVVVRMHRLPGQVSTSADITRHGVVMFRAVGTCPSMEARTTHSTVPIGVVTDATFDRDVLTSAVPVLVDFTTAWCGPCRALAPILRKVADERAGQLAVVTADGDQCAALAARLKIKGFPTVIVFARGQEVARHVGLATKEKLLKMVDAARPA